METTLVKNPSVFHKNHDVSRNTVRFFRWENVVTCDHIFSPEEAISFPFILVSITLIHRRHFIVKNNNGNFQNNRNSPERLATPTRVDSSTWRPRRRVICRCLPPRWWDWVNRHRQRQTASNSWSCCQDWVWWRSPSTNGTTHLHTDNGQHYQMFYHYIIINQ